MILGGKIMNNAYQTYLALTQDQHEDKKQHILFIPEKKIRNEMPVKMSNIKNSQRSAVLPYDQGF